MTVKTYQVVVTGQLAPGAQLEQVKEKVARLFNAPAAKLVALFAGTRVVVKKGLDQAAAEHYVAALLEAGLIALVESLDDTVARASPTTPTPAPVGVALVEAPEVDPPAIDISRLTMALPGERQVDAPENHAPDIDTSHLDMAPAGSDVGELLQTDFPPPPVTDHLTLE